MINATYDLAKLHLFRQYLASLSCFYYFLFLCNRSFIYCPGSCTYDDSVVSEANRLNIKIWIQYCLLGIQVLSQRWKSF
jgi:hypothetical protein